MQGPRLSSHSGTNFVIPDLLPPSTKPDVDRDRRDVRSHRDEPEESLHKRELPFNRSAPLHRKVWTRLKRHAAFVGNWATDLQAGSQYGYSHLFIVLLAGLIALLFQILSTRLGSVTGLDLAQHCRREMHNRPTRTRLWRWGALYPLYVLAEIGIVFTDLAELLGSAIAINLLIPKIPLWACVMLTSLDVFLILLMFNNYPTKLVTRSMRIFELVIGLLVLVVLASFVALIVKVSPVWADVFHGYVPGPGIVRGGGLYIAVGILGATAMPHAFFIGSKMATMRRLVPSQYEEVSELERLDEIRAEAEQAERPQMHLHLPQPMRMASFPLGTRHSEAALEEREEKEKVKEEVKPSLACVKAHLSHAVADITGSLLGFAILINSSILILAAAVFYYGEGKSTSGTGVSDLFDAYDLVKQYVGSAFAYLFAIGLLAAGQSASLTVTLAGQIISEGFIEWRTTPWKRRVITRSIGIVPSLAVAAAVGRDGIDVLLVGSQVALSIVLPFVIAPLILFTTSHFIMSIPKDQTEGAFPPPSPSTQSTVLGKLNPFRRRGGAEGYVSFANGTIVIWLCWILWIVITAANVYALYDLGTGQD